MSLRGSALSLAVFALLGGASIQIVAQPRAHREELIIKYRASATDEQIGAGIRRGRLRLKRHLRTAPMARRRQTGLTLAESALGNAAAVQLLREDPAIEYVEPNVRYAPAVQANDEFFTAGYQWGLYGDSTSPANLYGSQAAEAWAAGHTGSTNVFVAVIDEGIQIDHPDLAPNIWSNPFDPPDGLDNDGNGYADDVNGWDFAGETNRVYDGVTDDHGTHVAGTIGARGGDGYGVAGLNWKVRIIPAKFMVDGEGTTLDAVEAIDYVVDLKSRHGLNIVAINASWGGDGYSRSLHDAVTRAAKAGILFVAAAGNGGTNNDAKAAYPCNLDSSAGTATESAADYNSVISVAAIDKNGALASFSNYGGTKVHLGAPGVEVLSVYPDAWAYMGGTSMAAPHVSGAVALYASTHPWASAAEIRAALLASVAPTTALQGKTATGGRLDLSTVIGPAMSVSFLRQDSITAGSWPGIYGREAYLIAGNATNAPAGYGMSNDGAGGWIWGTNQYAARALEMTNGTGRIMACWYAPDYFEVNVAMPDNNSRQVSFYCLDANSGGRAQRIEIFDAASGQLLDTQNLAGFGNGTYLTWRITGSVRARFTRTGNFNAVISGIFIDPDGENSAEFVGTDLTTHGRWKGNYGSEAYGLAAEGSSTSYGTDLRVTAPSWVWSASSSNPNALDRAAGAGWQYACWYSPAYFDVKIALRDGRKHRVSLYCVDASRSGRAQRIDAYDSLTGVMLNTFDLTDFTAARYLTWETSGFVTFRVTRTGPVNAVAGGVFIDPAD